jgi:chemotaxis protein methyltransferase CheR
MNELPERAITELLAAIYEVNGFDARLYARASVIRRLDRMVALEGLSSLLELRDKMREDRTCVARCAAALASHPTTMYRQPEFFVALRTAVVPLLFTYPSINVWHIGCDTGLEVYALAILFHEEGLLDRCRIYATDACDDLVGRARSAVESIDDVAQNASEHRATGGRSRLEDHFVPSGPGLALRPELRERIVFAQHSWVTDAAFNEFQLVVCRDVMIYFDRPLQERLFDVIDRSLCRFGILGLGRGESLRHHPNPRAYQDLAGARLFRRVR